jgi:hypothetical protein
MDRRILQRLNRRAQSPPRNNKTARVARYKDRGSTRRGEIRAREGSEAESNADRILERFPSRRAKLALIVEPPSAAALVASELPIRLTSGNNTPPASPGRAILPGDKVLTNSHANGTYILSTKREKFEIQPIPGVSQLTFSRENDTDLHLFTRRSGVVRKDSN